MLWIRQRKTQPFTKFPRNTTLSAISGGRESKIGDTLFPCWFTKHVHASHLSLHLNAYRYYLLHLLKVERAISSLSRIWIPTLSYFSTWNFAWFKWGNVRGVRCCCRHFGVSFCGSGGCRLHAATADNTLMPSTLHRNGGVCRGMRWHGVGQSWRKSGKSQIIRVIERK
jgi:hypothetical protein